MGTSTLLTQECSVVEAMGSTICGCPIGWPRDGWHGVYNSSYRTLDGDNQGQEVKGGAVKAPGMPHPARGENDTSRWA